MKTLYLFFPTSLTIGSRWFPPFSSATSKQLLPSLSHSIGYRVQVNKYQVFHKWSKFCICFGYNHTGSWNFILLQVLLSMVSWRVMMTDSEVVRSPTSITLWVSLKCDSSPKDIARSPCEVARFAFSIQKRQYPLPAGPAPFCNIIEKSNAVSFYVLKEIFLKKFNFLLFSNYYIFLIFSNYFNISILKIIFKK